MVGSLKAQALARRDELIGGGGKAAARREDERDHKKKAAEYVKHKQSIFGEMLDTIAQQEADASEADGDEEEGDREPEDEDPVPSRALRKVTIAHRWSKEKDAHGELCWSCTTFSNPDEVAHARRSPTTTALPLALSRSRPRFFSRSCARALSCALHM